MNSQELFERLHKEMMQTMEDESTSGELYNPAADTIERLEAENAALREEIATAERQLRQQSAMIKEQAKCCDRIIAERNALRKQIDEKSKLIYQQAQEMDRRDDVIKRQEKEIDGITAERDAAVRELLAVANLARFGDFTLSTLAKLDAIITKWRSPLKEDGENDD